MKFVLLCLLFLPIIYLSIKQNKWYLYLFFAFVPVLPEQFSIELHEKLPMISGTRILILVVFVFWLIEKWKDKHFLIPKSLAIFFVIDLIVCLVNLRYGFDQVNRIFLLIFERVLPVVMISDMISDREEFDRCIDFLIMGSTAVSVIGIVQTIFEYDIASTLHLQETMASIILPPRMGLARAYGTYNAISFGCYCTMMTVPIIYRLYNTKKYYYTAALALTLTSLICTMTRSAWLCLILPLFILLLFMRKKFVLRMLPTLGVTVALCLVLCLFQPNLLNAMVETGKSCINAVIGVFYDETDSSNINEDSDRTDQPDIELELDENFGMNAEDPTYSRMAQWTAIEHMVKEGNALFGLGYNALPDGRIYFYFDRWESKWEPTTFMDVGLVALFAESGFVGGLAFVALLGFMLIRSFLDRDKSEAMNFDQAVVCIVPLFMLLNFLAAFMFEHLIWIFIALFYSYKRIDYGIKDRDCLALSIKR